jgi:hypothetical protein
MTAVGVDGMDVRPSATARLLFGDAGDGDHAAAAREPIPPGRHRRPGPAVTGDPEAPSAGDPSAAVRMLRKARFDLRPLDDGPGVVS